MHNSFLLKFPLLYLIYSNLRTNINYEKYLYLKKIKKGDIVLDIGANHGYYTSLFSEIITNYGQVHAFEPVPVTFEKLRCLKTLHKNVIVNQLALGRRKGNGIVRYNLNELEKASLLDSSEKNINEFETKVITLDEYVDEFSLSDVNFIKCDVEGFELDVIIGSANTLKMFRPQLSIEVTLNMTNTNELYHLLLSAGYKNFYKIEKGYPRFIIDKHDFKHEEYFYLHATH